MSELYTHTHTHKYTNIYIYFFYYIAINRNLQNTMCCTHRWHYNHSNVLYYAYCCDGKHFNWNIYIIQISNTKHFKHGFYFIWSKNAAIYAVDMLYCWCFKINPYTIELRVIITLCIHEMYVYYTYTYTYIIEVYCNCCLTKINMYSRHGIKKKKYFYRNVLY